MPNSDLFTPQAHARKSDPQTSHDAAASVQNISETQQAILNILKHRRLTDEQIINRYRDSPFSLPKATDSGIRSRRAELVRIGKVRKANSDLGRTASGRACAVWEIAE